MNARTAIPLLLLAACGSTPKALEGSKPTRAEKQAGIAVERSAETFTDERPVPKPTEQELRDFPAVWELFRKGDRGWPIERDRFKRRSDAAGYLLAAHLLRHYMQVNAVRDRAAKELVRVKDEIVAVGEPCAPHLVDMMVLDRIPLGNDKYFLTDDLTRQDCLDMLERMGPPAVPHLVRALAREDLGAKGRRLVVLALGGTRDGRAYAPIVKLLEEDASWQVRADAATALAKLGDRRALVPLQKAQRDPDPAVARRAQKARESLLKAAP